MAFVKVVKNKAYFMRFQTKFKRRREGKTDYFARKRLITQDKNKYNTAKYRLVARITSTRVIAQVIYATITGDKVFCQADSNELRRLGLTAGLSNYASAYATGLLLARRLLKKVGLDTQYEGNTDAAIDYDAGSDVRERRPFKLILDVGLRATTTGSKVFAVMKGAADGGAYVPHSDKRFPGSIEDGKNTVLRDRILGAHVDNYLKQLKGTERENIQFRHWNECLSKTGSKSVAELYQKIHAEIRKNPDFVKSTVKTAPKREHIKFHRKKLSNAQRKANVKSKIEIRLKELKKLEKKAKK
jgi:large subunit ribosomal protein L5e